MKRIINMQEYPRREQFEYFRPLSYPYVGVTVEVDVTGMVRYCRSSGYSFYLTFMHAVALAADGVPELRQRIHNGEIVEYDECPTSHVELLADGSYTYCTLHHHMDMEQYMTRALAAREACRKKTGIKEDADAESMYFISTLPWLHYTAMIQPVAGGDESNPRITWGKYEENPARQLMMPVSILAHHALVDGIHIARFYERLNSNPSLKRTCPPCSSNIIQHMQTAP